MNGAITKIYFIALFSSFFDLKAQDSLNITTKQHFFASLQGGAAFFGNFKINNAVIPITALYFSYIPKKSNIILSGGPSFTPLSGNAYFGFGLNAKIILAKEIRKHNFVFEAGDRLCWSQQTFEYGTVVQTDKYSLNNLYLGLGYFTFLGKESNFFFSLTGNLCVSAFNTTTTNNQVAGPHSAGLNSFSNTFISPVCFVNAGMKLW